MRRSNRSTHKLLVWLDEPVRNDIVRVNLFQNRLTLLDEPMLKVCPECHCPENKENNDGWYCETCNPELKNTDLFDAPVHQVARYKRKKDKYKIKERLERVVGLDVLTKITGKVISEGR